MDLKDKIPVTASTLMYGETLLAQSFACFHVYDLLLQQPPEQSHWWAGPLVQFTALSECDSRDLELPLAPVCKYVTIMIRIDDRTL